MRAVLVSKRAQHALNRDACGVHRERVASEPPELVGVAHALECSAPVVRRGRHHRPTLPRRCTRRARARRAYLSSRTEAPSRPSQAGRHPERPANHRPLRCPLRVPDWIRWLRPPAAITGHIFRVRRCCRSRPRGSPRSTHTRLGCPPDRSSLTGIDTRGPTPTLDIRGTLPLPLRRSRPRRDRSSPAQSKRSLLVVFLLHLQRDSLPSCRCKRLQELLSIPGSTLGFPLNSLSCRKGSGLRRRGLHTKEEIRSQPIQSIALRLPSSETTRSIVLRRYPHTDARPSPHRWTG